MNLRPPRPKRGTLPSCATSRYLILKFYQDNAPCSLTLPSPLTNDTQSFVYIPIFNFEVLSRQRTLSAYATKSSHKRYSIVCSAECYIPIFNFEVLPRQRTLSAYATKSSHKRYSIVCSAECYIPIFSIVTRRSYQVYDKNYFKSNLICCENPSYLNAHRFRRLSLLLNTSSKQRNNCVLAEPV